MLKLVANFKTSVGNSQTWSLLNPDTTNTPAELKGLLDQIGPLELFSKDGNNLYDTAESASFVEVNETILF